MICHIDGIIHDVGFTYVEIDVNGIGYHVCISLLTNAKLPKINERVKLFIHAVYREDSQTLYGFFLKDERDFFNLLISHVNGVGPKTAMNIMSRMSLEVLRQAIADRNIELLSKCQGLGKKTAEKLVVELSDKVRVGKFSDSSSAVINIPDYHASNVSDAISALVSLGYRTNDADKAVQKAIEKLGNDVQTEELLKFALKS